MALGLTLTLFQRQLENVAKPNVMVALHCFTGAELLRQHAKIWLPWQRVD